MASGAIKAFCRQNDEEPYEYIVGLFVCHNGEKFPRTLDDILDIYTIPINQDGFKRAIDLSGRFWAEAMAEEDNAKYELNWFLFVVAQDIELLCAHAKSVASVA